MENKKIKKNIEKMHPALVQQQREIDKNSQKPLVTPPSPPPKKDNNKK
jgi:hypothetical protein